MSLCKGFSTTAINYNEQTITEVLYALLPDGSVLKTAPHIRTSEFDRKGRRWFVAESVPAEAEFIGNYPIPSTRT